MWTYRIMDDEDLVGCGCPTKDRAWDHAWYVAFFRGVPLLFRIFERRDMARNFCARWNAE